MIPNKKNGWQTEEAYPAIGKGTVYRSLDSLIEEGGIRKDNFLCPLCKHPASDFKKTVKDGGKRNGSKQIRGNTDREKLTGSVCRGVSGKK